MGRIARYSKLAACAAASSLLIGGVPGLARAEGAAPAAATHAAAARPNILVWMLDDVGFAQLGSYGGLIDTPNLDAVARQGLRYTNYHATPICSASRAAFLTGRNPHAVHIGGHTVLAMPYPGYDGKIPASAGTLAANLREGGYITYAVGKWDHLPVSDISEAGPFTYWPSGQGFDRFFGFLSAETDQTGTLLWSDHSPVAAPTTDERHLTTVLADQAIGMIRSRTITAQRRPFFMYWATGAAHAPHQAPAAYLAKYRGRFDGGWDKAREEILRRQIAMGVTPKGTKLAPRPDGMPAWASLSADQKRSYARSMEAFAAYLTYADAEFGRMIAALKAQGEFDNTIIVVTSDNGASAEGAHDGAHSVAAFGSGRYPSVAENLRFLDAWGAGETYPHYPLGWAVAGNTPLRYYKATAYEGGIRVPLIVAWPGGIKARGQLRRQFENIADLTPTLLDAAGVPPAASLAGAPQTPFDGRSMVATFDDPDAPEIQRAQYFEMFGNVGIWKAGWKAVIPHRLETWKLGLEPPFTDNWELYDLRRDPSETTDLAAREPQRLAELKAAFAEEARKNNVLPLMNPAAGMAERRKDWAAAFRARKGVWSYSAPQDLIPAGEAPPVLNGSFVLTARFDIDSAGAAGPIMALGGRHGGMAFYLADGRPTFAYRDLDGSVTRVAAEAPLPAGSHETQVVFDLEKAGARVQLFGDGKPLGAGRIDRPLAPNLAPNEVLSIAADAGGQVSDDYRATPSFQGRVHEVKFDFNPRPTPPSAIASR